MAVSSAMRMRELYQDLLAVRLPAMNAVLCKALGHQRSRRHARMNADTGNWESVCVRCGVAMVRLDHKDWVTSPEQADQPRVRE